MKDDPETETYRGEIKVGQTSREGCVDLNGKECFLASASFSTAISNEVMGIT